MTLIDSIFDRLGYIPKSTAKAHAYSIGKVLDDHRREVENLQRETDYFSKEGVWRAFNFATHDDYLMRIYYFVHGRWPDSNNPKQITGEMIRARPEVLGSCALPEYQVK